MFAVLLIVVAYLFGSVSTAVVVSRLMGLPDPRHEGSKNPGATNVLRLGGKKAAILTLFGDVIKGVVPVVLARLLGLDAAALALVALAAFVGHLFPVFFGFKGGKGVATALGVLLGLTWPVGLAVLFTWLVVAIVWRISSLSALVAAAAAPAYMWWWSGSAEFTAVTALMSLVLIARHRSNIQNLLNGTEKRIGSG